MTRPALHPLPWPPGGTREALWSGDPQSPSPGGPCITSLGPRVLRPPDRRPQTPGWPSPRVPADAEAPAPVLGRWGGWDSVLVVARRHGCLLSAGPSAPDPGWEQSVGFAQRPRRSTGQRFPAAHQESMAELLRKWDPARSVCKEVRPEPCVSACLLPDLGACQGLGRETQGPGWPCPPHPGGLVTL